MTSSSLAITFDDLRRQIGVYLGYGNNPSKWGNRCDEVERDLQSGIRDFYFPAVIPGERTVHEWSFLRPVGSIVTAANVPDYVLPDDFGSIVGSLTVEDDDAAWFDIPLTGEGRIRSFRQNSTNSLNAAARPQLAAVRPLDHDGTTEQRFELMLWPTPISENRVQFRYNVIPRALSASRKYPYGGASHSETILAACLAAAERRQNDTIGICHQQFMTRLQASIARDRSTMAADNLGYNGDWSETGPMCRRPYLQPVTYNDVLYEGD